MPRMALILIREQSDVDTRLYTERMPSYAVTWKSNGYILKHHATQYLKFSEMVCELVWFNETSAVNAGLQSLNHVGISLFLAEHRTLL